MTFNWYILLIASITYAQGVKAAGAFADIKAQLKNEEVKDVKEDVQDVKAIKTFADIKAQLKNEKIKDAEEDVPDVKAIQTFADVKAQLKNEKIKDVEEDVQDLKAIQAFADIKAKLENEEVKDVEENIEEKAVPKVNKDSWSHGAADIWEINKDDGVAEYLNEGDMILSNKQTYEEITGKNLQGDAVNVQYDATNAWPNRQVPYVFDSTVNANNRALILRAIQTFNAKTCVTFVARSNQRYYVRFRAINQGCSSYVGLARGFSSGQPITLQSPGCFSQGTILHEMTHAVGYYHEQSRSDRDEYVNVNFANIISRFRYNFEKRSSGNQIKNEELTPYDLGSVMHYPARAFSSNGRDTITAKDSSLTRSLGQRNGFSALDICGIDKLYGCGISAVCRSLGVTETGYSKTGGSGTSSSTTTSSIVTTAATTPSPSRPGPSGCPSYVKECKDLLDKQTCLRLRALKFCSICLVQTNICAETCTSLKGYNGDRSSCDYWSKRGYCLSRYSSYMFTNCKKACGERRQCKDGINLNARAI